MTQNQLSVDDARRIDSLKLRRIKQNRKIPRETQDFEWKRRWQVLPTRQRLHHLGIAPNARCPNCRAEESQTHALLECVAAKPVWRLVSREFKGPASTPQEQRGFCQTSHSVHNVHNLEEEVPRGDKERPSKGSVPRHAKVKVTALAVLIRGTRSQRGREVLAPMAHQVLFCQGWATSPTHHGILIPTLPPPSRDSRGAAT